MANNRIAYGLAKKYGINTEGMTPKEVWAALKEKGVTDKTAGGAYNSQENKAQATANTVNERRRELVKKFSDEPEKDLKALDQPNEKLSKAEYAKVSKAIAEKFAGNTGRKIRPQEFIYTANYAYTVKIDKDDYNNFVVLSREEIE